MLTRFDDTLLPLSERPLFSVCIGMIAGIIISSKLPYTLLHLVSILTLCVIVLVYRLSYHLQRCSRLFMLGLVLSHLHVMWLSQALPIDHIDRFVNDRPVQVVTIEGHLYRPVERLGTHQRLYLRLHRLKVDNQWQIVKGQVRLKLHSDDASYLSGDVLRIRRVRLYPLRGFWNPGAFDLKAYMQRRNIYAVGGISQATRVRLLYRTPRFALQPLLAGWRRNLSTQLRQSLASPAYPTFMAMIFGQRGNLPPQQLEDFRTSGIAHLLVVSGLHVGFVATAFFLCWRTLFRGVSLFIRANWRPTPLAIMVSLLGIVLYCSVVGWGISTSRAAIMIGSSLLALSIGRLRELPYAIAFAAIVLCMTTPFTIFSISFQLSFVTVGSIALALNSPFCEPTSADPAHPWWQRLQTYLLISLAAYLGTLPILAGAFHTIPAYGLIANLIILPLASLVVPYSLVVIGVLTISPQLATYVSWPLNICLPIMSKLASIIATLPNAQIHLPAPSTAMVLSYYGLLSVFFVCRSWPRRLISGGLCLVMFFTSLGFQYVSTRAAQLRVTFLDVGSGDAILIQAPGRHNLLIDGGGTYDGRFDIGARVIAPVLWDQHINQLSFMAMTHPQSNHARGLVSIMQSFPTAHLMTNGTPLLAPYQRQLLEHAKKWATRHHTPLKGPREWQWGRLTLSLLAPPSPSEQAHTSWLPPTENDKSLVFRLEYGNVSILLTGDIQESTEQWLVKHRNLQADILQIPHHGSGTSSSVDFLRHVAPQVAIISLGANNRYGHPHARVLHNLKSHNIRVFRTDKQGAITVTTDGNHYNITPFHPSPSPP